VGGLNITKRKKGEKEKKEQSRDVVIEQKNTSFHALILVSHLERIISPVFSKSQIHNLFTHSFLSPPPGLRYPPQPFPSPKSLLIPSLRLRNVQQEEVDNQNKTKGKVMTLKTSIYHHIQTFACTRAYAYALPLPPFLRCHDPQELPRKTDRCACTQWRRKRKAQEHP